jgi:hypothetical protein
VGGGNGSLYKGTLPLRPADPIQHVHAHTGLVTSVQTHPSPSKHCRDLLLTSSLDWKVRVASCRVMHFPSFPLNRATHLLCTRLWPPPPSLPYSAHTALTTLCSYVRR